jgi:hypothetical protein
MQCAIEWGQGRVWEPLQLIAQERSCYLRIVQEHSSCGGWKFRRLAKRQEDTHQMAHDPKLPILPDCPVCVRHTGTPQPHETMIFDRNKRQLTSGISLVVNSTT